MKNRDKASLSCFMMGGFEIVDYSDSINQLHRKLLTKILLNKWKIYKYDILTNFISYIEKNNSKFMSIFVSNIYI
jgi:hypothetical protein